MGGFHSQQKQMDGSLWNFLRDLLKKLESFEEGWLALQRQVVDELLDPEYGGPVLQKVVKRFGGQKVFRVVQEFWHPRFRKHLDLEPPQEAVLCAFGQVEDNVVSQAGLDAFVQWAASQLNFNPQMAVDIARQASLQASSEVEKVRNLDQAVASILYSRLNPPGKKTTVVDPTLRAKMCQAVTDLAQQGLVKKCLGGAPAIISDVLAQLGVQKVHLYAMYHSDAMAALYQGQPQRLDLNTSPPQPICINQPGTYSVREQERPHPTRSSHIFTYRAGHTITVGGQGFAAGQDDRHVFRVYRYIGDHPEWNRVMIRFLLNGKPTNWLKGPKVDPDEWPFSFGFVRWKVNNGILEIEYLDEPDMSWIRDYELIILNAPGLATYQRTDPLDCMEAESLRQQLEWVAQGPAKVHLELSGEADPSKDLIQPFAQNVKGFIHSLGINDGELRQITALPDYEPPVRVTVAASEIYQRYERALRLAQELDVERLYVHGNDADLILRREGSPGDMRAEIQADLFAKGIVVLAVLQRTIGDWHGYLQADYAIAVARGMLNKAQEQLAGKKGALSLEEEERLKQGIVQAQDTLKAAEQELGEGRFDEAEKKAKEAQETVKQTFRISREPGQATISLSPLLLAKSFRTLIEFAYDYVRFSLSSGDNDPNSISGLTPEGEEVFQRIVETGYYVTRDRGKYSVAVVPVMWPKLPIELNPTGAGDICSGVTAVYSGF